jgi:hypothetical protein
MMDEEEEEVHGFQVATGRKPILTRSRSNRFEKDAGPNMTWQHGARGFGQDTKALYHDFQDTCTVETCFDNCMKCMRVISTIFILFITHSRAFWLFYFRFGCLLSLFVLCSLICPILSLHSDVR